ncbi:MAG TPA: hypothetical protein VML57_03790 [Burkholderiales bacterium]|nr:hypothetical protein [Burkholderiales bacterium]
MSPRVALVAGGAKPDSIGFAVEMTGSGEGPEGPLTAIPMGRVGTVAETAALIVALCGDDAGYMTGVTLDENGASYMA